MTESTQTPNTSPFKLWMIGLLIVLAAAIIVSFTGYTFGLPFVEHYDEGRNLAETYILRDQAPGDLNKPGYPPGILWVYQGAQIAVEATTGDAAYAHPTQVMTIVRFGSAFANVLTVLFIWGVTRKLSGEVAGIATGLAWLFLPLVVRRVEVGLPQSWETMLYVAALYFALLTFEKKQQRWAIISVLIGLINVIFKYTAFPVLGLSVGAALWNAWQEKDQRTNWLKTVAIQFTLIIICAIVIFAFAGVGQLIDAGHGETTTFIESGPQRLLDLPFVWSLFVEALSQLYLDEWVNIIVPAFFLTVIIGSIIFWRRTVAWQRIIWIFTAGLAAFHVWFLASYLTATLDITRYTTPVSSLTVILLVVSIFEIVRWLVEKIVPQKDDSAQWMQYLPNALGLIIVSFWMSFPAQVTLDHIHRRTLPGTQGELMRWAARTLPAGEETLLVSWDNARAFNTEWGGYEGPIRPWIYEDIQDRTLDEWRDNYVFYAQLTGNEISNLAATEEGQTMLNEMLLLRQFPSESRQTIDWRGPSMSVYRLWSYQNEMQSVFGDSIRLLGYDINTTEISADEQLMLTPYWSADATPSANYQTYVHLVPIDDRQPLAQADAPPSPRRQTIGWNTPDEILIGSEFTLTIPSDIEAGQYHLILGLYDPASGQRLLTESGDDFVLIAEIEVVE